METEVKSDNKIPNTKKVRMKKFFVRWLSNYDISCWANEEMFRLMGEFFSKHIKQYYISLQEFSTSSSPPISIQNMKYSQLVDILDQKPLEISNALLEVSYLFMANNNLFEYFKLKEKYNTVRSWINHFNNVFFFFIFIFVFLLSHFCLLFIFFLFIFLFFYLFSFFFIYFFYFPFILFLFYLIFVYFFLTMIQKIF